MAGTPEKMLEYLLETHMDNRTDETQGMFFAPIQTLYVEF